jgi:hypothetical protein
MSTRGAYGFKINNQEKILFSRADSYPDGLGKDLVDFISKVDLSRFKDKISALNKVPKEFENKNPLFQLPIWDYPLEVIKQINQGVINVYFDAQNFTDDVIFCEYFYLLDFDENRFKVYQMGRNILLLDVELQNIPNNYLDLIKQSVHKFDKIRSDFYLKLLDSKKKNK